MNGPPRFGGSAVRFGLLMSTTDGFESADLNRYRGYLQFLARLHLQQQCRSKIDHSDIVQQCLLQALAAHTKFRGRTEAERQAWLRKILVHEIAHATRDLHTQKRDIKRERSIEAALDESSMRLAHVIASRDSTPSHEMVRQESMRDIAAAIEQLPENQRQVLILRYWDRMSVQEVALALDKSTSSIAGLLHQATKKLRKALKAAHD